MEAELIRPYRVDIPQSDLDDLARRLDRTRWPDEAAGVGQEYGVPLNVVQELTAYWRSGYNWRAAEAQINAYPQFRTVIDGHDLHVVHVRSAEPRALPLLLLHGCPGSIVEFLPMVGALTDPVAHGGRPEDAFDVMIPTIPGFGFSGVADGWSVPRAASAFVELMRRLGYDTYAVHGGDTGAAIARELGLIDADHVVAVHVTALFGASVGPRDVDMSRPEEVRSARKSARYRDELGGYAILQSTKPQSLAYALTDSPVGLLAWIVEQFMDWTDSTPGTFDAVDRDTVLTDVMIDWLNRTAGSSARYYRVGAGGWGAAPEVSRTPTAVVCLPRDIATPVRRIAESFDAIVRWTEFPQGGHFGALEQPELMTADLRDALRDRRLPPRSA